MMDRPTNSQRDLGLDVNGFPRTDETGEVDLEQIEFNLSLTPQERFEQYFEWMEFADVLRAAGRRFYGVETRAAEAAE